jgi:hypothetical protein
MKQYIDFGLIKTAQKRDDGSIDFYGRVARVGQMPYFEKDASGKYQRIMRNVSRDTLFDNASIQTIKLLPITNGHTVDAWPNPDNFKETAIGMTGTLVVAGLDGDFLGVVGSIKSRDGIASYEAGIRELSPGYECSIADNSDGTQDQLNRRYRELALVPQGRGGADVRIKDSAVFASFDPEYFSAEVRQLWLADGQGLGEQEINNLMLHGSLSPPKIIVPSIVNLPSKDMTTIAAKIGTKTLSVTPESVQDAAQIDIELKDTAAKLAAAEQKLKDAGAIAAENAVLKDKVTELEEKANRWESALATAVKDQLAGLAAAQNEVKLFDAAQKDTKAAKACLLAGDLKGYQDAIVACYGKDAADRGITYNGLLVVAKDQYGDIVAKQKDMPMVPSFTIEPQLNELMGGSGMVANLMAPGNLYQMANGIPADSPENGWYV